MSHSINDVYALGHLAYETDQTGTVLATFTYDSNGVPMSVQVGSDPNSSPRYYYVYNGHGDVVALGDGQGTVAASYNYDAFGQLTSFSENFGGTTTWTNPYRYDGKDGVRYDGETGLYWMSVRAYDPALGRFLSRDPLSRVPLFGVDQPYVYAGNNPLINVDPSGQRFLADMGRVRARAAASRPSRMRTYPGRLLPGKGGGRGSERLSGKGENVWSWKQSRGARMAAWMGPIEKDSRGWHFNLHIENKNGETLANYHFYYLGWQDFEDHTGGYVWYVKDTDGTSVNYREPLLARNNWFALAATDVAVGMTIYIRNKFRLPEDFAKHLTGEDEFRWTRVFEEEFGTSNYLQDMLSRLGNYPVTKEKNL